MFSRVSSQNTVQLGVMGEIFQVILTQPLANGLIVFYHLLFNNMGLAIIGFSLFLRLVLIPLTKPATDNMKKIRMIQPNLAKLKKKYGADKQGYLKAQAELYKQNGINPTAGCIPQILQLVVLIAFYNVFRSLLSGHGVVPETFNELLYGPLKFPEGGSLNTFFLYLDVSQPDVFHIPGISFPLPGFFVILAALVQFVSAKISMPFQTQEEQVAKKTKTETDDMAVAMQSSMIYTFPLMTLLIGVSFPAGLALYWLVFSVFQSIQQYMAFGWGAATPWVEKAKSLRK